MSVLTFCVCCLMSCVTLRNMWTKVVMLTWNAVQCCHFDSRFLTFGFCSAGLFFHRFHQLRLSPQSLERRSLGIGEVGFFLQVRCNSNCPTSSVKAPKDLSTGYWFAGGGDILTGALHVLYLQVLPPPPSHFAPIYKVQNGDILPQAIPDSPARWPFKRREHEGHMRDI